MAIVSSAGRGGLTFLWAKKGKKTKKSGSGDGGDNDEDGPSPTPRRITSDSGASMGLTMRQQLRLVRAHKEVTARPARPKLVNKKQFHKKANVDDEEEAARERQEKARNVLAAIGKVRREERRGEERRRDERRRGRG